jgi:uncharacterized protein YegJ (DUF2314 family)
MCKDCGDKKRQEWQKKNKQKKIRIGDFVKIPVSDINGTEHLWFEVYKKYLFNRYIGRCDNTPIVVEKVKYKGLLLINRKDIEEHIPK